MSLKPRLLAASFLLLLPVWSGQAQQLLVGNLFGGNNVLSFNSSTGSFTTIFASGAGLSDPEGMAFGPDGNFYVNSYNTNQVLRFNGTTGAFIDVFVPFILSPQGLSFGPDGNLYVSSWEGDRVVRFNGLTGAFIDIFASGGGLDCPSGLGFGPDGNLYVTEGAVGNIKKFNGMTGAFMSVFASVTAGGFDNAAALSFGPDGNLYVTANTGSPAQGPSAVLRFQAGTGLLLGSFVPVGFLNGGRGLVFGPDGNLYVSDFYGNRVLRFNGTSGAFIDMFVPGFTGGLNGPRFLTFSPPPAPSFNICLQYDPSKAHNSGATVPIKLQLCSPTGANLSSLGIVLHATAVVRVSNGSTTAPQSAGNANPGDNFRYAGQGYIFNLKTTGLAEGSYELRFTAGPGSTVFAAPFRVR